MTQTARTLRVAVPGAGEVTALLDLPADFVRGRTPVLVLAHGAGNDCTSPFLASHAAAAVERGSAVLRFNFPYKERGGTRPPDRWEILCAAYAAVVAAASDAAGAPPGPLFLGGKSMGSRVAAALAAAPPGGEPRIRPDGLVFLGFPLHRPGEPERLRDDDLRRVRAPMLFVQGTRDPFCDLARLADVRERHALPGAVHVVDGGDHSFAVPARAKARAAEIHAAAADAVAAFLRGPLPPSQIRTNRWPTIGERAPEPFDAAAWRLDVAGLVGRPLSLTADALRALPHVERSGTVHCVTRWSRPATAFRGVPVAALLDAAGVHDGARFVRFASGRGHDTSLPIGVARDDVLVADAVSLDGGPFTPIDPEHGGPFRTVTFARYFYKSVKWIRTIEALADDRLGFWERTAGYHNGADPWREQRYVVRGVHAATLRKLLAERDLTDRDLLSADLRGADLAGARLVRASLRNAVLAGADLRGADLTRANCTNADLRGADLRDSRIEGIDLDGADLRGADLRGAVGVPASLAVTQFHSSASDGAHVEGLDWRAARLDGLLPPEEAWLRARGVLESPTTGGGAERATGSESAAGPTPARPGARTAPESPSAARRAVRPNRGERNPPMHPTRNDLPEKARRKLVELLQVRLSDAIDLSLQTKQAHWNVKGPQFIALHELFDGVHARTAAHVDEIAERIVQLGGTALGTVEATAKGSHLPAYPNDAVSGHDHVEALSKSLAAFGRAVRGAIDVATKLGDADTADLFTEISRAADKDLWFVEAHLGARS